MVPIKITFVLVVGSMNSISWGGLRAPLPPLEDEGAAAKADVEKAGERSLRLAGRAIRRRTWW